MKAKPKRGRGRPRAALGTVRILANGVARLSSDLAKPGQYFAPDYSPKNGGVIYLNGRISPSGRLMTWSSGRSSTSPLLSLVGTLHHAGLDIGQIVGVYRAEIQNGDRKST